MVKFFQMKERHLLRRQIVSEIKLRNRLFFLFVILSLLFILFSIVFDDMGIFTYLKLKGDWVGLENETAYVKEDNAKLREEIKRIKEDPYYLEKRAREDLGLVKPDEYIFKYE